MAMPKDIRVVDTMLDLPAPKDLALKERFGHLKDSESREGAFKHPAGYMFKETPEGRERGSDPVGDTLREMDKYGIETAVITVSNLEDQAVNTALKKHRDRFVGSLFLDPNDGMDAVRMMTRAHGELGIVAAGFFPCGPNPQVPINDKRAYPIYAKCVELDIACFVNGGVPGPRLPYEPQYVGLADEVCWFFPDLRFIFRHGCEPWTDLAVKLLLKWPNLYYSTSAFAPKYYPKDIIDFANNRGADKIIYGGYYPSGLTLERIFREMQDVPFKDAVWPKFLRDNARRVLKLDQR
jgi:predicted TIM-barrel fold metal-dependent hydrolase